MFVDSVRMLSSRFYITRDESFPYLYENTDFSPETIKSSIREGEMKTLQPLKEG